MQFPENYVSPTGSDKIDPYVLFKITSQANIVAKRTPAEKDGGSNPKWNYDISFDIVDQYTLNIEVSHQNIAGSDVQLGLAEISLLPVFKKGEVDTWVTLRQRKANGGTVEKGAANVIGILFKSYYLLGDLNIFLRFIGPPGIAYPQHRPEVDAFDDSTRKGAALSSTTAIQEAVSTTSGSKYANYKPEFTEEEIRAAFRFIDLDHNDVCLLFLL